MGAIYLDDKVLPGYDHRISVQEQIERNDLSGLTSQTAAGHGGWKPAILTISLKIAWDDTAGLAEIKALWVTREKKAPKVWIIAHATTQALGIIWAQFSDFYRISGDEFTGWDVSFNMIEVDSMAALKEEREAAAGNAGTTATGTDTSGISAITADIALVNNRFTAILATVDDWLGKNVFKK